MDQSWYIITKDTLMQVWRDFLAFSPKLIAALFIFVIGWIVSLGIGKLIAEILGRLGFNKLFEKSAWKEAMDKAELKVSPSDFIGAIFKWVLIIVTLWIDLIILGYGSFEFFLSGISELLMRIVVATVIFIVAVVIADISEKVIKVWVKRMGINHVDFIGGVAKWSIYIFAGMAVLVQLGIAETLIETVMTGIVATIALAVGLAFGLGGKDAAARAIQNAKDKLSGK
ncbi:MAG: hypothetical protein WC926_04235 [Candidatus Paceibacterota bacterium]|jgi:hypothetical protein